MCGKNVFRRRTCCIQAIQNREEHGNRHFVEKNEIKYCIEIKYSPIQDNAVRQIHTIAKECRSCTCIKKLKYNILKPLADELGLVIRNFDSD